MDSKEFRKVGKEIVDYIADYMDSIRELPVLSKVEPGFMELCLPEHPPSEGHKFQDIMEDFKKHIVGGTTHWNSPKFFAYFPAGQSYPSICADMLSSCLGCVGFSWISSPSCTELEIVMMDWLCEMLDLPEHFKSNSKTGGGVIQASASESTLICLMAARSKLLQKTKASDQLHKLVMYGSDQSHSSVERAGMLASVILRKIPTNEDNSMNVSELSSTILADKLNGLYPFYVVATLGTTSTCSFDNLALIGNITKVHDIWLHIDSAYAGSAFICPEYRFYMKGIELADSFNFNPHKWLLVNYDVSALWLKNHKYFTETFKINPSYLQYANDKNAIDFRQIKLAHRFESYVIKDDHFYITHPVNMGLVCFRHKGSNSCNQDILDKINRDGRIHIIGAMVKDIFILRFVICAESTKEQDVDYAWNAIKSIDV
ncbi:hypothetical protein A3Q56_00895 [Intoshia linei]|uniref:Aromatic-L-amino-acid decarboxylase n=1 Tax=Intoshia linei TaxID=1819745 RepID=A0A177BCI8_9BILA|nr:hypothetical protein A3Q56_00895 [Intoshia linei]